jgi:ribosomal protein L32
MYPEFIAIFVCFGILAVIQIVTLVLMIVFYKKLKSQTASRQIYNSMQSAQTQVQSNGVAFCLNCGAQFDAAHKVCPRCGKPR